MQIVAVAVALFGLAFLTLRRSPDRTPVAREIASPAAAAPTTVPRSSPPRREAFPAARAPDPEPPSQQRHDAAIPPRDHLSERDVRRLVEHVVENRLARHLSASEYDRLTDAVMRLRAAAERLRSPVDSSPGERERDHAAMLTALADIRAISGVPPAELGGELVPDDAASVGSP